MSDRPDTGDSANPAGDGEPTDLADAAVLESFRLADSSLPVGTDSVSYGLEAFVAADRVTDADDLAALLETYLRRQLGPGDLVALRAAHRGAGGATGDEDTGATAEGTSGEATEDGAGEESATRGGDLAAVCRADRRLAATTLQAEFRESAERTGGRLLALQRELRPDPFLDDYAAAVEDGDAPGAYPVVLGAVAARAGVGERRACLVACQEFATAFVGAAQRLLQLGHTEVQRVVVECQPAMATAVEESADRSLAEMTPFAPLVDVQSAAHERADRRLFLS